MRQAMKYSTTEKSKIDVTLDKGSFLKVAKTTKRVRTEYNRRQIIEGGKYFFDSTPLQNADVGPLVKNNQLDLFFNDDVDKFFN